VETAEVHDDERARFRILTLDEALSEVFEDVRAAIPAA
jgi:hypothetical protein